MPWQWKEKLDEPASPTDIQMSTLHTAPVASTALVGALHGACRLATAAGYADPEHVSRLACLADACEGVPFHELVDEYGPEHAHAAREVVGSFFGSLFHAITAPVRAVTHLPGIKQALSVAKIIPGIGPAIDMGTHIVDMAGRALPHPGPHVMAAAPAVHVAHPAPVAPMVPHGAAAMDHSQGGTHFHCVPFG